MLPRLQYIRVVCMEHVAFRCNHSRRNRLLLPLLLLLLLPLTREHVDPPDLTFEGGQVRRRGIPDFFAPSWDSDYWAPVVQWLHAKRRARDASAYRIRLRAFSEIITLLELLRLQSRMGEKLLRIRFVRPQNGTAVLNG